jgi:hypothetical protein
VLREVRSVAVVELERIVRVQLRRVEALIRYV